MDTMERMAWGHHDNRSQIFENPSSNALDDYERMEGKSCETPFGWNSGSFSVDAWLLVGALLLPALCILYNVIFWYKFVSAWNSISRARRMDISIVRHRRRQSYRNLIQSHVHVDNMSEHMSCPICMNDFFEQELVTSCDDGCGSWYHRQCLIRWLDQSDNCPCCRKDMLTPHKKSWGSTIVSFWGMKR
jgi:hypothetical protein